MLTCDVDQTWTRAAQGFREQAGVANKIDLRLAPTYYEYALRLVKPSGLIIADNTATESGIMARFRLPVSRDSYRTDRPDYC